MNRKALVIAAALAAVPLAAHAQTSFRCIGKDGKKYYSSTIPRACIGEPIEQLNSQGMVIRRIDPEGDEKARRAREAQAEKKRAQEAAAREAARRNRALLATYANTQEIDGARRRALADNQKAIKAIEVRIAQIRSRQSGYEKELALYKEGANRPPERLLEDVKNAQLELKYQEELLTMKKKEIEEINERYDEDKRRYIELTGRRQRDR